MKTERFWKPAGSYTVMLFAIFTLCILILTSCDTQRKSTPVPQIIPTPSPTAAIHEKMGATLYLAQAQFSQEMGDDGKTHPVPGAARLVILSKTETGWTEEVLEDPDSNVFHKAAWFSPVGQEPGILTIGATQAFLKLWHKVNGAWTAQVFWNPTFGGKFDRLRDFEVADVTGDNIQDIVVATHDQGVVAVLSWKNDHYEAEELTQKPNTFVHEIEVGDVDGDSIIEIFTTPSHPNKMDGSIQPGEIDMWKFKDGKWNQQKVASLETRHAKEVLCATPSGEAYPVLFVSLEGERIGGQSEGDTTRIQMIRFQNNQITSTDIAGLPGRLCRFLTMGDTDGNAVRELIASTSNSGIWKLTPPNDPSVTEWDQTLIASGTSGFEHATFLFDFNADGKDEIYVASDDQGELRQYAYTEAGYDVKILGKLKSDTITFNITAFQN